MKKSNIVFLTECYAVQTPSGSWHPAIKIGSQIRYWPNVTKITEGDAAAFAVLALQGAYDAANKVADEWNVYTWDGPHTSGR